RPGDHLLLECELLHDVMLLGMSEMKLRLGVGFATRSSQARRPKHGLRIITSPIASCFAFRNLPRSARPFVSVQAGRKKPACRVRYISVFERTATKLPGTTPPHAPWSRVADRSAVDREMREHRGGRRGEPPARSKSGRTPASLPRAHAICAHCVRDVARTPHPCPSPPITFRPGSAAPPPTVSVAIPCDRSRPGLPTTTRVATSLSSPRPVQDDSL
ncbi:MAG: hypothetical protein QOE62_3853, partial [Actinomycetota bacterium]|nr:hypothetical protein [Actinomycetota bacterium]